jgi:hypothetical protein
MNIFGMNIIEHPSLGKDEAWIIFNGNARQVPQDLRDTLPVPCILSGDKTQTKHILTFLQAVAEPYTSDPFRQPPAAVTLLGELYRHPSLLVRIS